MLLAFVKKILLVAFSAGQLKMPNFKSALDCIDCGLSVIAKRWPDASAVRNVLESLYETTVIIESHNKKFTDVNTNAYDAALVNGDLNELDKLKAQKVAMSKVVSEVTALDETSEAARVCTSHTNRSSVRAMFLGQCTEGCDSVATFILNISFCSMQTQRFQTSA